MCWGVSLALLRARETTRPWASTAAALLVMTVSATLVALALAWIPSLRPTAIPSLGAFADALPLALGFGACVLFPALFGQIWGARLVPAATASLLTMTEILMATLSASWLGVTTLGPVAIAGGALIVGAALLDLVAGSRRDEPSRKWSG